MSQGCFLLKKTGWFEKDVVKKQEVYVNGCFGVRLCLVTQKKFLESTTTKLNHRGHMAKLLFT